MASHLSQLDPAELSKTPSVSPPPGATIDFEGPNPLEATTIIITSVFMGLAFSFVCIRAYTKIKIYGKGSWDDLTCLFGFITTLAYWIIFLLQVVNEGFGQHLWNIPLALSLSEASFKLGFISPWLGNIAYIFVKLTFFILYWIIFKPFRWLKFGIIGGAVVIIGFYVICIIISVIEDAPLPGNTWLESAVASRNGIAARLSIPLAACAITSDVFILLLPISGVLRLQLSPKKRLGLLMVFMTGFGACVCSSFSLYYRTRFDNQDMTYTLVNIEILAVVELCVGISITCVPATSVYLRHVLPPTKVQVTPYIKRFGASLPLNQCCASHSDNSGGRRTSGMNRHYQNPRDAAVAVTSKEEYELGLYSTDRVKTNVVAGPFEGFHGDRIHLNVDLEQ